MRFRSFTLAATLCASIVAGARLAVRAPRQQRTSHKIDDFKYSPKRGTRAGKRRRLDYWRLEQSAICDHRRVACRKLNRQQAAQVERKFKFLSRRLRSHVGVRDLCHFASAVQKSERRSSGASPTEGACFSALNFDTIDSQPSAKRANDWLRHCVVDSAPVSAVSGGYAAVESGFAGVLLSLFAGSLD